MNRSGKILLNGQKYGGAQLFELTPPAEHHHIVGPLVTDSDNNILATGSADIVLSNGIATINFAVEFEQDTTYEDNFWGLNTNCFNELNIPSITPTKGGFWDTYNYTDLMKLSPTFDIWNEEVGYSNNDIWTPSRYKWEYPLPTLKELFLQKTGYTISDAIANTLLTYFSTHTTGKLYVLKIKNSSTVQIWIGGSESHYTGQSATDKIVFSAPAVRYMSDLVGTSLNTISSTSDFPSGSESGRIGPNEGFYDNTWYVGTYNDIAESGGGGTEPTIVLEKLPSNTFSIGTHLHGTCYGTYNLYEVDRGRIVNGDNIMY